MKSTIKKHLTILLLAGIGGSLHAQQAPPPDPYRTVLVAGTVEAVNAVKVESKLDGTSTIVWVVNEGKMVKKGDPLVELDPSALKEMISSAEIGKLVASRNLAKAKGKLEVAKTSNALATKVARNAHQADEANLKHFQAVGMKTISDDLQARVAVAAERIRAAEKILALKGNPALQVEVINAQATLLEAHRVLKLAQAEQKQFQDHTAPQKLRDMQLAVAVAETEIAITEVNNKATHDAASHEVDLEENKLRASESKLADLKEQLANAKIVAPMDGLVVYHVAESSRYGGSSAFIEKGTTVRKGQDILQIIDTKELRVALKVHESRIMQLHRGAPVSVKIASLPGRSIRGVVSYVSPVASAAERWGSNKKVHKTEVRLLNQPAHVRPGQSVIAEITLTPPPRPGGLNIIPSRRPQTERPGSGRPRLRGSSGSSSTLFKVPDELKLTAAQKQKWDQAAKTSKAAFDAAIQQRDFAKMRTVRDDFDKEIKKILTATQMAQYEKIRAAALQPSGGGRRNSGGRRDPIMDLDTNKDGKVSNAEYGKLDERVRQFMGEFSALDTNGDGGITKKEADAARQKLLERFRSGGSPTPSKEDPKK
jgi:multidrug efflux pump subunit AcrA (membrane-fusion protein)